VVCSRASSSCLAQVAIGLLVVTIVQAESSAAPDDLAALIPDESKKLASRTYSGLALQALQLDYQGRHDAAAQIIRQMQEHEPTNPEGALLEVENQYWFWMYDTPKIRDDEALRLSIESALEISEENLREQPDDYLARSLYGRALMDDARRLAMTGSYYSAGSRSEKARKILEDVVANRPEDMDARYQLGNYYYWSSVMPAALQAVNWLWFIPTGNRPLGLEYLNTVSVSEGLHADGANLVLGVVEMYHAPTELASSEARLKGLHRRYPRNVLIHYELLELLFILEQYDALLASASTLEARVAEPQPVRAHALMAGSWRGRVALTRGEPAEALTIFDALAAEPGELPHWGSAWVDLMRGQALDLLGRREDALVAYDRVLSYDDLLENHRASDQAERLKQARFDPLTFREQALILSGD
jgi:tetratricopeptide (TPR) repeat protein